MSTVRDTLQRIAAGLERIAPPLPKPTDWTSAPAYMWDGETARPLDRIETVPLERLRGIDRQKQTVVTNVERLAAGAAAHDMLLWGARGMGKSALVRAAVASHSQDSLALIQITPAGLPSLADLVEELTPLDRAFVLFLDDLGFEPAQDEANRVLRSLIDGGIVLRPSHIRFAVTTNRRAIVGRETPQNGSMHERDERDNALALADRFGLTVGFHPCGREAYLDILRAYTEPIGLEFDEEDALGWALARGNRSGRSAYQYACELAGRAGLSL